MKVRRKFFPRFSSFLDLLFFFSATTSLVFARRVSFLRVALEGEEEEVERRGGGRGRRWKEGRKMMRKRKVDENEEKGNACIKIREVIFYYSFCLLLLSTMIFANKFLCYFSLYSQQTTTYAVSALL